MNRSRIAATLGLFFLSASNASAGAWTQPAKQGLFIAQATYFSSSEFFDVDGARVPQDRFSKLELQPYVEYGLKPWLTVGGSAYLQGVAQDGDENYGLGDPEAFARARLWQGERQVISVQPLIKLRSLYADPGAPRGGSVSTDMEFSLLYGRNLDILSDRDYADMRVGYRWRGAGLNPQWRTDIALGLNIGESWQIIPAARIISAAAYDENAVFREDGEQDYDLMKLELTAAYHISDTRWFQATFFEHVMGAQAGAGRGFSIGIAERF